MWARCPHTLSPLTILMSSKVKFKWKKIEQDVFEEIKRIVARNTLLDYLDFMENLKYILMLATSNW